MMPFAGGFTGQAAEGLNETVLVKTTSEAAFVNAFQARMPGVEKMRNASSQGEVPLVVRLQGTFKTAFPDGPPSSDSAGGEEEKAKADDADFLKESTDSGVVILVSDVDMLNDRHALRGMNFFGQTLYQPANDNFAFVLNMVEQLAGSEALIGLRSRGSVDRPFDLVKKLERDARAKWQKEELKLTKKLQETQQRLNDLQRAKEGDQQFILSPEQQQEIEDFREQRYKTQQDLKQVQKNLRRNIDQLGMAVKAANMALMPALVAVFGIVHGVLRRRKASR
jgi:ABC-type uncharacterized transport system involved in gliding motility auxiliary subunit